MHIQDDLNLKFGWNQWLKSNFSRYLNGKLSCCTIISWKRLVLSITHRKWLVTRQGQRSKTSYALQLFKPASLLQKNGWVLCYWNNRTLFVILPSLQRTQTAFYWAFFWRSSDFISSLSFWIARVQLRTKRWNFLGSAILYYQLETI
jgi:hypothetical protein